MNTFISENLRTEARFDKCGNGQVLVEVRSWSAIVVHSMTKDEAIALMEWLSVATKDSTTTAL